MTRSSLEISHRLNGGKTAKSPVRSLGALAALIAFGGGLLVLTGWFLDIEMLKRVRPGLTAMNPLTALNFVLGGAGIALLLNSRHRAALMIGVTMATLALLKMFDLAFGDLPVDRILFADRLAEPGRPPNRLAPNTAVAVLLAGVSLALATGTGRLRPLASQGLAACVLLIAMFAVIGYGFGMNRLHSVGPFIPMAIHTALLLLVLGVGLLLLKPDRGIVLVLHDKGAAGAMARTVLPLALLIPVAVGAVRIWGQQQGYYGTEVGVALQVIANVLVTSVLLISSIAALHHSDILRRSREQAVTRSEAQYRLAEKVANVGHWRMDVPYQMTWSDELYQICGLIAGDGMPSARQILNIYHPDDRPLMRQSVRDALRIGTDWDHKVRICRPDGEVRHVSSQGVCERNAQGRTTGLFGVFADVTELEHARHEAEAATTAKAAFLANMSHEIRTPLNGVMGFAELLRMADLPPEQKRQADLIFDSAGALLKLLNDILDVSKIEAGQFELSAEPYALGHQLRQCVRLMEPAAQKKGLALSLVIAPDVPQHIVGDGLRMRQVILNLLGNAVKFTDRGSVAIEAMSGTSPSGARVLQISVTDTGVGIAEARLENVFEEFVQADPSIARRFGGSGLGLNISQRLVKLMGGVLILTSEEGRGTRVMMTVPLIAPEQVNAASKGSEFVALDTASSPAHHGARILLVEDLDINQELLTGMLNRMGCHVEIASNGAEAIELASQLVGCPDKYQLIFMDVQMPIVDGLTATRAIRALAGRPRDIPIIGLTANAYATDVEQCRDAGMNDHLAKPVSMAALGANLTFWLPKSKALNEDFGGNAGAQGSLAAKFALRMATYAERLTEIQSALGSSEIGDVAALLAETEAMAHNLAGTARIFGHGSLGDLAAEVNASLRHRTPLDVNLETRIGELVSALRLAA